MGRWRHDVLVCAPHRYTGPFDRHLDGEYLGHGYRSPEQERDTLRACLGDISRSTLLFAYIDDPSAFGTFAEIGYAKAKGVLVAIAFAMSEIAEDMWFLRSMSDWYTICSDPAEAFTEAVAVLCVPPSLSERCESPIEKSFVLAMEDLLDEKSYGWELSVQVVCGPYRIDAALTNEDYPKDRIAIELDGHDWHEKTKEQAAKDKARDRFLTGAGYRVLRWTGAEVHANAGGCAREALHIATKVTL